MRILKIQIEGFGKLRGYSLSLTEGLNAHCVENGCGKTTLIAFIKAMLYGLADSRSHDILLSERKHYRPWQGGAFGGSMTVLQGDRILRIHRRFGARPSEDTLAVYDEESGEQTEALGRCPGQTLLSLDAESFTLCAVFSERAYTAQLEGESVLSHLGDRTDTESADTALARLADEHRLYEKRGGRGLLAETESALAEANARQAALAREAAALPEKERAYKEAKAALAALTDKAPHVPARKKRTARHISLFASVLLASLSMIGSLFHILFLLGLFPRRQCSCTELSVYLQTRIYKRKGIHRKADRRRRDRHRRNSRKNTVFATTASAPTRQRLRQARRRFFSHSRSTPWKSNGSGRARISP